MMKTNIEQTFLDPSCSIRQILLDDVWTSRTLPAAICDNKPLVIDIIIHKHTLLLCTYIAKQISQIFLGIYETRNGMGVYHEFKILIKPSNCC